MKFLLIHGFEGTHESHWFPWLKLELEALGHEVLNLTFPKAGSPVLTEILDFYRALMDGVDSVVGHSLGAFIALKLAEEFTLEKLILVAPVLGALDFDSLREQWLESDVDALEDCVRGGLDLNKLRVSQKTAFFSSNDPYIPLKDSFILDESWACITLDKRGHFNQKDLPELLSQF